MQPLRFGILGSGMVARYHVEAIRRTEGAELVGIARNQADRVALTEATYGVPCETDIARFLARKDIDIVCICTPSGLHAAHAIAAANAGKHVLVEKPLALTLADADAMIAACQQAGVILSVVFQRRTDSQFRAIKEAISDGDLGRLVYASVSVPYERTQNYYDSADWRGTWALDGGGVLMNQAIHFIDMLLWYMGDIAEVSAWAATLSHTIEVEDCLSASLRFKSGALGIIGATTNATPGFSQRLEVYGDNAGVQIEGDRVVRAKGDALALRLSIASEAESRDPSIAASSINAAGHTRLVQNLVAAIRTGKQPFVTGEEGRRSLAAVLAIYKAAGMGTVM